ncbi:aldo/keto reductase [Ornithinimicrobium sediminis]|uniref:aldo/keto reductase n=1 Tax=Ornithinimicrobium sediminis TaxID=2904603 RepID=UPI001E4EF4B0|nr:aldo/keto reductase [Ornithinimicrobium sediminis]MCE0486055.1 aldo/keto reductase [Ornithinimicrobium sediminis]
MRDLTNRLVLGTMYFGTRTDEATSRVLLDRFVEGGGRTLDTADCYSFWTSESGAGGQSEAVVGAWLADHPGLRTDLEIASKVGMEPREPGAPDSPPQGLGARVVERSCARSLERLGVDSMDVYWVHGEDRSVDLAEVVTTLGGLVDEGVVGSLGISNHPTWRVERARALAHALGTEPFTALQLSTSYLRPRPGVAVPGKDHRFGFVVDETWDYLAEHPEMELWVYSPLLLGAYDRSDRPLPEAYDHPGTTRRLEVLDAVAREVGARRGQVVLAWMLHRGPQVRPIVGASSVEQLDEALAAARIDLSPEQVARLDAAC